MPRVKGKAHSPRNKTLIRGLGRLSRSASYSRSGAWAVKNKVQTPAKTQQKQVVTKKFGKKNETRVIRASGPSAYPTEDVAQPLPWVSRKRKSVPLRSSITPGTILILLAGRHRGKRVVFLKQLPSGLLLVTGPFKINGVPLKRVNQAFVIATSKKLDVSGVKVDAKINDSYFKKTAERKKKTEAEFFAKEAEQHKPAATKVEDQKAVDKALLEVIKKDKLVGQYLASRFSLSSKDRPHEMKF
mmetsp:Transcript_17470/g.24243  ORF Transcript_17470/g.24243 Transcript_17470/m.24243 type:complete len:243 (+) Transcript_17470:87-815(+)